MNNRTSSINARFAEFKFGKGLQFITQYRDLLFPIVILMALGTFFVPLPPPIIDLLVALNLALSFIVVTKSLSISNTLQLTSYPTILLITPVFRLCLSVSISRSILETGRAGALIETVGKFSAGGNLVVAFVIFAMILFVQFIVVTKGAERVAEVAARFTLDAMPGKQMSIDADLRSGLISQDQARKMRASLGKESQLYGAMDGAMKFVKGDTIATIALAFINVIGGLIVGVLYKDMSFAQAARRYTILSIGDGLAATISSMMVAFAAGFVITRVSSDDEKSNIGTDLVAQFFNDPKPLWLTAAAMSGLALLPGTPKLLLLFVGVALAGSAYLLHRNRRLEKAAEAQRQAQAQGGTGKDELTPTFAVPLAVVVSPALTPLISPHTPAGAKFRAELPKLRSAIYYDVGVILPNIFVSGDAPLKANQYFIAIKEVPVAYGIIKPDSVFVNDSAENIKVFGLDGEDMQNPADLSRGAWIPMRQRGAAESSGLKVWEAVDVITLHLSNVLKRYAHEFVGIQESQAYLDFAARGAPKLVEEVVPKTITVHQFTEVMQRLVQEGISIRDIKSILDALGEWGRIEKDPVMLTEYVRSSLKRYISFRYTTGRETLYVYLLDPEIEDIINSAIRRTSTGSFLSLDPALAHDILDALRREILNRAPTAQKPIVITDMELRRFVRKMFELEFPEVAVLSYQELAPSLNVQPLARISMRPPQSNAVHNPTAVGLAAAAAKGTEMVR
jgi:type III secretion protein V